MNRVVTHTHITTQYREELDVLIVRWMQECNHAEIVTCYKAILDRAIECGCTRWHIDLRRRNNVDNTAQQWFCDEFLPRLSAEFPQGVRIAYVVSPLCLQASGVNAEQITYCGIMGNHSLNTVITENEAQEWLHQH